jgi:hypothetical protein
MPQGDPWTRLAWWRTRDAQLKAWIANLPSRAPEPRAPYWVQHAPSYYAAVLLGAAGLACLATPLVMAVMVPAPLTADAPTLRDGRTIGLLGGLLIVASILALWDARSPRP